MYRRLVSILLFAVSGCDAIRYNKDLNKQKTDCKSLLETIKYVGFLETNCPGCMKISCIDCGPSGAEIRFLILLGNYAECQKNLKKMQKLK